MMMTQMPPMQPMPPMQQGMPPSVPQAPYPQNCPNCASAQPPRFPTGQAVPQSAPPAPVAYLPAPRAVRGVRGEELTPEVHPTHLDLPAPEQLGIVATTASAAVRASVEQPIDWTAVHRRLDAVGVTCFQVEHEQSGWRVVCLQPCCCTPGKHHRVETQGSSQAEAIQLALEQVERPGCK
jgi:hypothetical protein